MNILNGQLVLSDDFLVEIEYKGINNHRVVFKHQGIIVLIREVAAVKPSWLVFEIEAAKKCAIKHLECAIAKLNSTDER